MSPVLRERKKQRRSKGRPKSAMTANKVTRTDDKALLLPQILHPDIFRHVVSNLPPSDLAHVIRVNKALYDMAGSVLYRRITVDTCASLSRNALQGSTVDLVRKTRSQPASPCGNLKQRLLDYTEVLHVENEGFYAWSRKRIFCGLSLPRLRVLHLDREHPEGEPDRRFLFRLYAETLIANWEIFAPGNANSLNSDRVLQHLKQIPNVIYVIDLKWMYGPWSRVAASLRFWWMKLKEDPAQTSAAILFKVPSYGSFDFTPGLYTAVARFCANHTIPTTIVGVDEVQMQLEGLKQASTETAKFTKRFQDAVEREYICSPKGKGKNLAHVRFCTVTEYIDSVSDMIGKEIRMVIDRE